MRIVVILLIAGIAAALVRYGPGFEADERDLDPTISVAARDAIHVANHSERNIVLYLARFMSRAAHGDFGVSRTLNTPVRDLVAARGRVSLVILLAGAGYGWLAGFLWTAVLTFFRRGAISELSTVFSTCILCVPVAVIAVLGWNARWSAELVLGVALCPRIFQVTRSLVIGAIDQEDVVAARSRGIGSMSIFAKYILPSIGGQLLAWMAATAGMSVGALVPIEVIFDVPGLGQLAWKAALARDLPVLLTETTMVAILVQLSNHLTEVSRATFDGQPV